MEYFDQHCTSERVQEALPATVVGLGPHAPIDVEKIDLWQNTLLQVRHMNKRHHTKLSRSNINGSESADVSYLTLQ